MVFPVLHMANSYSSFQIPAQNTFLPKAFPDLSTPRWVSEASSETPDVLDYNPSPITGPLTASLGLQILIVRKKFILHAQSSAECLGHVRH